MNPLRLRGRGRQQGESTQPALSSLLVIALFFECFCRPSDLIQTVGINQRMAGIAGERVR